MQSPDSLRGRTEPCPACHAAVAVPALAESETAGIRASKQRRNILAIVGAVVVGVTVTIVVVLHVRGRGRLPPTRELVEQLASLGYYPTGSGPGRGILRGRSLVKRTFVMDATCPSMAAIDVWHTFDREDRPVAISTTVVSPGARMAALDKAIRDQAQGGGTPDWVYTTKHADGTGRLLAGIVGNSFNGYINEDGTYPHKMSGGWGRTAEKKTRGFSVEFAQSRVSTTTAPGRPGGPPRQLHSYGITAIVRGRRWKK